MVFDLGVRQRRALDRRPHDGLRATIELVRHQELVKLGRHLGFGGKIHGGVAVLPFAQHAKALELVALRIDPLGRIFAAGLAEFGGRDLVLLAALGAELFLDFPFDRQAVAIPARNVVDVVAHQKLRADDEVLEDLVERVPDMDIAVGVGRTVVQNEQGRARLLPRPAHGVIEISVFPLFQHFRLGLGQAGAHRKFGLGQEDGLAVIAASGGIGGLGFGFGHVNFASDKKVSAIGR